MNSISNPRYIPLPRRQQDEPLEDAAISTGRLLDTIDQQRAQIAKLEAERRRLRALLQMAERREQALLRRLALKRARRPSSASTQTTLW